MKNHSCSTVARRTAHTVPEKSTRRAVASVTGLAAFLLAFSQGAAGCSVAQVSERPALSAATVMSPAQLPARTQVTHFSNGHAVIIRNGSGTDITVQRTPGHFGSPGIWPRYGQAGQDWHDMDPEARFRWPRNDEAHPSTPSLQDEYRRRMLQRLDSHR